MDYSGMQSDFRNSSCNILIHIQGKTEAQRKITPVVSERSPWARETLGHQSQVTLHAGLSWALWGAEQLPQSPP